MTKRALFLILGLSNFASAADISLNQFKLLNDNESSVIIDPSEAQSLLNIDVTPGGKSVKKRSGYGVYKDLGTGQTVRGGYHFYDASGNEVQVWISSKSIYGIVADATPTQLVSSATVSSTMDCADTQGNAYCVTSARDLYLQTNGATKTWYTSPLGTMVEATPDRIVVAGVSGNTGTLYFSQSGTYTNFTVGLQPTDPFTEVIASPGSKITHIRWGCGKLLWWKDQSFGFLSGDNQYNVDNTIVSDTIGSLDNTSAIDPGGSVWFRGQDGHIWRYDCSGLQKMSVPITPDVLLAQRRTNNSWQQTTQADWQAGSILTAGTLSTTLSAGDVVPSSITIQDTSGSDFSQGSFGTAIDTTTVSGAVTLTTYFSDAFSSVSNWTNYGSASMPGTFTAYGGGAGCATTTCGAYNDETVNNDFVVQCTLTRGSGFGNGYCAALNSSNQGYAARVTNAAVVLCETSDFSTLNCISAGAISPNTTSPVTLTLTRDSSTNALTVYADGVLVSSTTDSTYTSFSRLGISLDANTGQKIVDDVYDTARTGAFTSRVFDTGFSTPTYGTFTANTSGTGSFVYATRTSSASANTYGADSVVTSGSRILSTGKRYLIYSSTITATSSATSLPQLTDVSVVANSTGTFYSQVKNAPNLTSWDNFAANTVSNGGSHSFYTRAAMATFTVLSATPTWTAQTVGAVVSGSTGTYFQVRDDFSVTTGTDVPTLNDFTVNWHEGAASDQAYMLYFDNAIWTSLAYGAGQAANNYIFKYDLINDGFTLYNFGAGGMLVQNNVLYFGAAADDIVYRFGSGTSDAGATIQSYWTSKSFTGPDPWSSNAFKQIDNYFTRNANQTATITYTLDTSSSTSYSVPLSSSTQSIIRHGKLLPSGKNGQLFSIQVGDTSSTSQWEWLGFRTIFDVLPYRPSQ